MPILKPLSEPVLAHPGVELLEPDEHRASGRQRPVRVLGGLHRRAEHGHDAVAHVGHERAAVVEDLVAHRGQVAVSTSITSSGSRASANDVNPRKSLNRTVASIRRREPRSP
jgi:hypothetical protein